MTSSSWEPGAPEEPEPSPPPELACEPAPPAADASRYIASASLCDACWSRSAADVKLSAPPVSRAFLASARADSNAEISAGSSFALFYPKDFSVE
jgi:hypothetical protein